MSNTPIPYPYLPSGKTILYVALENPWMQAARETTDTLSTCPWWPTGAVLVKNNTIIGHGANSGTFQPLCPRFVAGCKTGEGYELCADVCLKQGHAEVSVINNALAAGQDPRGADLYLFGHWWCCENCWNHMIRYEIANVFLPDNAMDLFTRDKRTVLMHALQMRIESGETIDQSETRWTTS